MKMSTKGRYGSRAMVDLALHYNEGPISLKAISERQNISVRYLENIMTSLVAKGIINSTRGKKGGFTLARPPKEVLLGEIIAAVEGSISPVKCADDPKTCRRSDFCETRYVWVEMKDAMNAILDSTTLQDMVDNYLNNQNDERQWMYQI